MTESAPVGLRERKRLDTRRRLERAAVEIVVRDGLEHATVESISALADVSSRTFFNYFDSKEDAILGVRDVELTDQTITDHLTQSDDTDAVASVVRLLLAVMGPSISDTDLRASRMELARQYPHLLGRQVVQFTRMASQLESAVATILTRDPRFGPPTDDADARLRPELLLSLCGGAVRVTVKQWMADDGTASEDDLDARAIALVRNLVEKLT